MIPICPCCAKGSGDVALTYEYGLRTWQLRRCAACGSLYYDPPPEIDYRSHTESEYSIRDYVEINCSIDILAGNVMTGIAGLPPGRLLDVGCGYGFAADVARRLGGWDVTGVEPSTYGKRGSIDLALPIIHDFVGPGHPIENQRFDAIFTSEVLEHVTNPAEFLGFFASLLNPNGRLVISTPDAASLNEDRSTSERLAALSPGAHVSLFSRQALVDLFVATGFPYVSLERRGVSFFAIASRVPFERPKLNGVEIGAQYIEKLLASGPLTPSLAAGMRFRLFSFLVGLKRYAEAMAIEPEVEWSVPISPAPRTIGEYYDAYRGFAAWAWMQRGALYGHQGDHARAATYLMIAHELCKQRLAIGAMAAVSESAVIWHCLSNAATEIGRAGDLRRAAMVFDQLTHQAPPGLPPIPPDIAAAAAETLRQLRGRPTA